MLIKKIILITIFLFLSVFLQAQDIPVIPVNTTTVESYDMPNYFLVCTASSGAAQLVLDGDKTFYTGVVLFINLSGECRDKRADKLLFRFYQQFPVLILLIHKKEKVTT